MKKTLLAATLLAVAAMAHAEPNPAKKELINKMLQLQQPVFDGMASAVASEPASRLMQQAGAALQFRVAPEKREALGREIQADVKKYGDDVVPLLRERTAKLAPNAVGPLLDEKFSEDELRQLVAILESPVLAKFSQLTPTIQKTLTDKLVTDMRSQVEPKVNALRLTIDKRVNAAIQPAK